MAERLNILVLHRLGDPSRHLEFLREHVYALQTSHPEHTYVYHDVSLPVPGYIKEAPFEAIILDVTLLCARWDSSRFFDRVMQDCDFVRESRAVKLAFPQDEYDCNEILDEWMVDWDVDIVFSVIASNWDVLYPQFHRRGRIELGFTGYVDDALLELDPRPFAERSIDVGYRARKLLPYFGRIGQIKWTIGRDVERLAQAAGLRTDIRLGESGTLFGRAWRDFLNDSKFTLGANSGSSMLDPRGEIQERVRKYVLDHPNASFTEVEHECFPGVDMKYQFTAISPRVLEAGVLGSCQVLVEGDYSGIVKPWEHYIPIKPDASDFDRVLAAMQDAELVDRLIHNCRQTILERTELRQSHQSNTVIDAIRAVAQEKRPTRDPAAVRRAADRYAREMPSRYRWHWRRTAAMHNVIRRIEASPLLMRVARKTIAAIRRIG